MSATRKEHLALALDSEFKNYFDKNGKIIFEQDIILPKDEAKQFIKHFEGILLDPSEKELFKSHKDEFTSAIESQFKKMIIALPEIKEKAEKEKIKRQKQIEEGPQPSEQQKAQQLKEREAENENKVALKKDWSVIKEEVGRVLDWNFKDKDKDDSKLKGQLNKLKDLRDHVIPDLFNNPRASSSGIKDKLTKKLYDVLLEISDIDQTQQRSNSPPKQNKLGLLGMFNKKEISLHKENPCDRLLNMLDQIRAGNHLEIPRPPSPGHP